MTRDPAIPTIIVQGRMAVYAVAAKPLGQGNAGSVHKVVKLEFKQAQPPWAGRKLVIKVIRKAPAKHVRAEQEKGSEIESNHPQALAKILNNKIIQQHIVSRTKHEVLGGLKTNNVYEIFNDTYNHFVVMDYVPGVTLSKLPENTTLLVRAHIAVQIATQLYKAHSRTLLESMPAGLDDYVTHDQLEMLRTQGYELFHNDVNDNNIIYDAKTGHCQIIDWDAACEDDVDNLHVEQAVAGSYRVGTLPFFTPEMVEKMQRSSRGDVYIVGLVFYRLLLSGVAVELIDMFPRQSEGNAIAPLSAQHKAKILQEPSQFAYPTSEKFPDLELTVKYFVLRMLSYQPLHRPDSEEALKFCSLLHDLLFLFAQQADAAVSKRLTVIIAQLRLLALGFYSAQPEPTKGAKLQALGVFAQNSPENFQSRLHVLEPRQALHALAAKWLLESLPIEKLSLNSPQTPEEVGDCYEGVSFNSLSCSLASS